MANLKDVDVGFAVADRPPTGRDVTEYDRELTPLYVRLLDAQEAKAPWEEVCRRLLGIDPDLDRDRARLRYETHVARAAWMRDVGLAQLASPQTH